MMPSNAAIAAEIAIAERMAGSADASVARYAEGALDGMRWAVGALAAPPGLELLTIARARFTLKGDI